MAGILQGFRGFTVFNPTAGSPIPVLCRAGGQIDMPRNLDMPAPIDNQVGVQNFSDGLLSASAQFSMIPMVTVSGGTPSYGWWTTSQLQSWFATYTNDDLAAVGGGGIDWADAVDTAGSFNIVAPKAAGFRVSAAFGEPITFYTRWAGTKLTSGIAGSVPTGGVSGGPIQFNAVTFGGSLSGLNITSVTLDVDLGTTPNPNLNGTLNPTEMNAGILTGRLSYAINGTGAAAIADNQGAASIIIAGVTFNMGNLITTNPNNRNQSMGRKIRSFEANVLTTAGSGTRVVTIS